MKKLGAEALIIMQCHAVPTPERALRQIFLLFRQITLRQSQRKLKFCYDKTISYIAGAIDNLLVTVGQFHAVMVLTLSAVNLDEYHLYGPVASL
jgi:hypothetical protein